MIETGQFFPAKDRRKCEATPAVRLNLQDHFLVVLALLATASHRQCVAAVERLRMLHSSSFRCLLSARVHVSDGRWLGVGSGFLPASTVYRDMEQGTTGGQVDDGRACCCCCCSRVAPIVPDRCWTTTDGLVRLLASDRPGCDTTTKLRSVAETATITAAAGKCGRRDGWRSFNTDSSRTRKSMTGWGEVARSEGSCSI